MRLRLTTQAGALELTGTHLASGPDVSTGSGAAVTTSDVLIGIRPHDIEVTPLGDGDAAATVEVVEALGAQTTVHVNVQGAGNELARVMVPSSHAVRTGDRIGLRLRRDRLHLFDQATGRRL